MKHLKIVQAGWETYSSYMGGVLFKDGVTVHPLPQFVADRISSGIQMVEINEDGSETPAGVAHRLVAESGARAAVVQPLERASDADLAKEAALDAIRAQKAPVDVFYSAGELEKIVDEQGLKGLRVIGDQWGVKHRSIPVLLKLILDAQTEFLEARNQRLQGIADRTKLASEEAELGRLAKAAKDKADQEEADRVASTLIGSDALAASYTAGEVTLTAGDVVAQAHLRSKLTVTGWNKLEQDKRDELISEQLEILGAHYGVDLVPVIDKPADEQVDGEKGQDSEPQSQDEGQSTPECLLGSSVLASTYEIGGKTVQLGDIVRGAFVLFGGTADEWNDQGEENREALLRQELDRLLAAE